MAISNPFNDNNHTNNNHIVITIYVILRSAMSIGNRYLHFCKHDGGRVLFFCNYTVIAQLSLTHMVKCVCTVKQHTHIQTQLRLSAKGTLEFQLNIF